jgi:uncharacterized protein YebE (UPF0316 family)
MDSILQIMNNPVFAYAILPVLIFCSRIVDVSVGTMRIIFVSRQEKVIAPILGFFESLIWLVAISQIMLHLDNVLCYIAYSGGFAMGNYVGLRIEDRLAMGTLIIRIFLTRSECDQCDMKEQLSSAGFGVTSIDAQGKNGEVKILYSVIKRRDLKQAVSIIEGCQSRAFYSIEEARSVKEGIFPKSGKRGRLPFRRARHYVKYSK